MGAGLYYWGPDKKKKLGHWAVHTVRAANDHEFGH